MTTCSASTSTTAGAPVDHPLFLVCTHGKHDRCCAKYGRPLYDAVCEQVEDGWVWQSTHVGGDRFAGNLVVLPEGVYYGRVEPSEAWPVLEAALDGRVHLPHYRGRSCHGFPAQAAERGVREQTGLLGVFDVRVARDRARRRRLACAGRGRRDEPTTSTCTARRARRPISRAPRRSSGGRRTTSQEPLAHEPPEQHEPARLVERAGQLGAAERRVGRDEELQLGGEPLREAKVASLEDERRAVQVGDHRVAPLELGVEA